MLDCISQEPSPLDPVMSSEDNEHGYGYRGRQDEKGRIEIGIAQLRHIEIHAVPRTYESRRYRNGADHSEQFYDLVQSIRHT